MVQQNKNPALYLAWSLTPWWGPDSNGAAAPIVCGEAMQYRIKHIVTNRYLSAHPDGTHLVMTHDYLTPGAASERRGNNLKGFKTFSLQAKARIWPCLSLYVPHSLDSGSRASSPTATSPRIPTAHASS